MTDTKKLIEFLDYAIKSAPSDCCCWASAEMLTEIKGILENNEKLIDDYVGLTAKYQDLKESLAQPDDIEGELRTLDKLIDENEIALKLKYIDSSQLRLTRLKKIRSLLQQENL